ncbi:DUF695 domain-containing protein [Thalassolituus marinus]|uniref:DUF695 domain-containing protein n=1 Tax=Thalassolituus marinus TaxID=671053 RepID=A0ABS7ZM13_9GAMM|nr:DUF695 domain-containing protein [Thalassolituus marinus]MCA6062757.1 DUF695 domain-containing protein [Thalassolituus marinus]
MLANNRWIRASGSLHDKPISIQYREDWETVRDADHMEICVQIAWQADSVDDSTGFPALSEQSRILTFSEHLQQQLEPAGNALVSMVIAHDGVNQWIIYCRDLEVLKEGLNQIPTGEGLYPIEVVADEDPSWNTFTQVYQAIQQQA